MFVSLKQTQNYFLTIEKIFQVVLMFDRFRIEKKFSHVKKLDQKKTFLTEVQEIVDLAEGCFLHVSNMGFFAWVSKYELWQTKKKLCHKLIENSDL